MSKQSKIQELEATKEIFDPQEQARKILSIAYDTNIDDVINTATDTIVSKNVILDDIHNEVEKNNLASVHNLISSITDFEADYFGIDGYGNYYTLTSDSLSTVVDDMIQVIANY